MEGKLWEGKSIIKSEYARIVGENFSLRVQTRLGAKNVLQNGVYIAEMIFL